LVKTTGPAIEPDTLAPIDVVLLSHEHHSDNLDPAGREFLPRAGRVLTTVQGADKVGDNAIGLMPWSSVEVERPDGPPATVTAVPAQHGPYGAVRLPHRFGGAYLTLSSDRAAEAAKLLGVRAALPVQFEGWTHFTQGARELRAAFAGNGVADRLVLGERGETVTA
jgi:L-ascorbate metabolism protein UlaG (beta-lactamase superfamily)